ncbi:hypothetical protein [Paenibacillus sp. FSL R10-2736]|uniref:hypothetical protein n=1 Tax=Paenibacillus sp. FSL R10-2736 TaxID=2954692 RepID=UPI0030FB2892
MEKQHLILVVSLIWVKRNDLSAVFPTPDLTGGIVSSASVENPTAISGLYSGLSQAVIS